MIPPRRKVKAWQAMKEANNASGVLKSMSRWLAEAMHGEAQCKQDAARRYATIFEGIDLIHNAIGNIPTPVYQFRYATMREWLRFIKGISPGLASNLSACL